MQDQARGLGSAIARWVVVMAGSVAGGRRGWARAAPLGKRVTLMAGSVSATLAAKPPGHRAGS